MSRGRRAGALLLLLLPVVAGCAPSRATPVAQTASPAPPPAASPSARPSPHPSDDPATLLDSQPATLDALRATQARRPVQVLVPGVASPAPVEQRTTDPTSGELDLPDRPDVVAWWSSGAAPGDGAGSVVLAAHVSYRGQTGPFTRLARVAPGTRVVVTSADGTPHTYAVTSTRNAPKTALDRGELFRTTGPAALVLLTCGGPYDRATHSFEENVVVSASPV